MKRLFKFLVAAATSFSLLFANIPLTQMVVRADGDEVQPKNYTLSVDFTNPDPDPLFLIDDGLNPGDFINAGSTFTASFTNKPDDVKVKYMYHWDQEDEQEVGGESYIYTVPEDAIFKGASFGYLSENKSDGFVLTLELLTPEDNTDEGQGNPEPDPPQNNETEYTVEVHSNLTRNLFFEFDGHTQVLVLNGNPGSDAVVETITFRESELPDNLVIDNPGGVGVENLGRLTKVVINGSVKDVTARYDRCEYEMPGKDSYNEEKIVIEIMGDDKPGGVIEWTNSGCPDDQRQHNISEEEQFKNGSARVVGVYEATDTSFQNNIMADYGIDDKGSLYDAYNGCLRLENGYWIAFEFIPEPGYQLVEFGGSAGSQGGNLDIGTTDKPNVYYFQMPQGNCHFSAVFDDPANIVKINGDSIVNDGAIEVPANEFAGGTAQMSVGSLDGNTRSAYDNNAGVQAELKENDLEIEEYLSLDLANIYQKANTNDYWEEDYHNLEKGNASVTLKVDDDFNPDNNKVYIVHDKGGDEGVETIEAEYDPNTHEITFETGSFSNFMIATSDEANDIEVVPDEPERDDPESEAPGFVVELIDDEVLLGNWEGEDDPFFVPVEPGQAIPGDSVIENNLPSDLPPEIQLIYFINEEEAASFNMDEREPYSPGHFVTFDRIEITENTCEIYFNECWVVGIDVILLDLSMKALDKDGKEIKPLGDANLVFECGDAGEEDFTYFEIPFAECPSEIVVKGVNGYAIFWLGCNDEDILSTPIGENKIPYPSKDDYIWVGAWGMIPETETVNFTDSLTDASAVFEGVSEDKAKDYLLLVTEIDVTDAPAEEINAIKKQIAEKGYTDVTFPMGFDITLYDRNGIVHEPGFTVKVTLVLKEALTVKDGETVLILHMLDEGFELIEAVYNAKDLTLTFETKTFSPFVVTIGTKAAPAAVVKTGETVNTTRIVIASILIGAAAAAGILFIRRRETEIEKEEN
ncbi:MAG: hypothetical protein E7383_01900 [Ruminococcaceae bacterium]|nr:hypothetical protein [Oscillospiraceae bacterium]